MNFNDRADEIINYIRINHEAVMAFHYESSLPFESDFFRTKLASLCKEAGRGAGLSYELYVQRVSEAIHTYSLQLIPALADEVIKLAISEFDYADESELNTQHQWNETHGYCTHSIELGCCPAGCGS